MKHMDHNNTFQKYPAYKDSGVEWIGEVPKEWEVRRLRNVCKMLVSNVDKLSKPLEYPIRLCNYVDVYKNEFITSDIQFMEATASNDEIRRFSIKIDDVIITKDSEDWLDIGVPALVKYEDKKLICGYHLAILRPKKSTSGQFLHRALLSQYIRTQFSVQANGVTRYGISHGAILGTFIVIPPLREQTRIAHFLDQKNTQIEHAIAQKERLIELLKERRQILIHNAVTRGLDPNLRMKDSGVEWIGEVPEHWVVVRNYVIFEERNEPGNDHLPILSISIHTAVSSGELSDEDNIRGKIRIEDKSSYKAVKINDVSFNMMRAWQGAIGAVRTNGMVSPAYVVAKPKIEIDADFFEFQYRTANFIQQMDRFSKGITDFRKRLYWQEFKQLVTVLPPLREQKAVSEFIINLDGKINKAISLKQSEIEKLKEYKATLINSAVTGKIKLVQ
jgi:type I restriction enzyme S subunit